MGQSLIRILQVFILDSEYYVPGHATAIMSETLLNSSGRERIGPDKEANMRCEI